MECLKATVAFYMKEGGLSKVMRGINHLDRYIFLTHGKVDF